MLFRYNRSVKIYKCPADSSTAHDEGKVPRSRSVSMTRYMNHIPDLEHRGCWHFLHQIQAPPPSRAFVYIDEHENSIDNARFTMSASTAWLWIDFPAARHHNGCVLSFADAHAETWRWREPNTLRTAKLKGWIQGIAGVAGKDRDLSRLYDAAPKGNAW